MKPKAFFTYFLLLCGVILAAGWLGADLGEEAAFFAFVMVLGLAVAFAVTLRMRQTSLHRRDVMRSLGFSPAPEGLDEVVREARESQVFDAAVPWFVDRDRIFRGTVDGLELWVFDFTLDLGGDLYPGGSAVAASRATLRALGAPPAARGRNDSRQLENWRTGVAKSWAFCWKLRQTVSIDPSALAAFLQDARQVLPGLVRHPVDRGAP